MDNGMELRVKDYCAFCPDFEADVDTEKELPPIITHLRLTIQNRGGKKYLNSYLGMLFLLI